MPGPDVEIDEMEAEITGATRQVERSLDRRTAPGEAAMARRLREFMTREAWRTARLSDD